MDWYVEVLKKYAEFNGRARRKEYWYFFLFNFLIAFCLIFFGFSSFSTIYSWAVLLPSVAVGVRRMHDVNKSGWYLLIPIYNLILAFTEGVIGSNEYGDDPKRKNGYRINNQEPFSDFKSNEIKSKEIDVVSNEPENKNNISKPIQIWDLIKEETIKDEVSKTTFIPKKKPVRPNIPKQT